MKVTKADVKVDGLTNLYQPDDPSGKGLDIIFVHGLGGHPVRTWLHTGTTAQAPPKDQGVPGSANTTGSHTVAPTRNVSLMRHWASPSVKRGKTLKKRPPGHRSTPPGSQNVKPLPRPQTAEPKAEERAYGLRQNGAPVADADGRALTPRMALSRGRSSKSTAKVSASPRAWDTGDNNNNDSLEEPKDLKQKETYWPLDFLPALCPSARIFTFGFQTHMIEGQLVPGQVGIFTRGRELLDAVEEMRQSCEETSRGREIVFVAHSTGGIVVKEMLRLASDLLDAEDEGLLASIASVIFLGCPLKATDYASMVVATRSMAATTTGVVIDDRVLRELLGGDEDAHLTHRGQDVFEAVWREHNFRVKVYQETSTEGPLQSWAEWGLALRRNTSTLKDNPEAAQDLPGDHVGMCKFGSTQDGGYRLVSSYINRLAYHPALKHRQLTEMDKSVLEALARPDVREPRHSTSPQHGEQVSESTRNARVVPQWLANHQNFQAWLHRSSREDAHKLLCLSGPPGSGQSELLSSLQAHISERWSPETHSSAIMTINASEGASLLESVLFSDIRSKINGDEHGDDSIFIPNSLDPSAPETLPHDSRPVVCSTISTSPIPVLALRSLLSQLYVHDRRLRNLVLKRTTSTAAASPQHNVFDTTLAGSAQKASLLCPASYHMHDHSIPTTVTRSRRWSDPTHSTTDLPSSAQTHDWAPQATGDGHGHGHRHWAPARVLEDAEVLSLFLEDYLHIGSPRQQSPNTTPDGKRPSHTGDDFRAEIPSIRRVFILVDAAQATGGKCLGELLWCLGQLASRSDFSVCVATPHVAARAAMSRRDDSTNNNNRHVRLPSPAESTLLIQIPEEDLREVWQSIDQHLSADMEERAAIAEKMLDRAGGVRLWAELVTAIVNDASEEGVSGEIVLSMLDDIAPSPCRGCLDDVYAWKLTRPTAIEQAHVLVVMQWVMLAPEPLRLNDLLVALRLTLVACRGEEGGGMWDTGKALSVEPAMSLKDLRKSDVDDQGIGTAMDSPTSFWKWLRHISQGLLKLDSGTSVGGAGRSISSAPLGLQRVRPAHESVQHFFLKGRGFQTLLPAPEDPRAKLPSTDKFIDTSYYTLLHVCLAYLNMTDLDSLGRERKGVVAAPGEDLPPDGDSKWRQHAGDQRRLIMASYPFLRYTVDNLVFHLLCPRALRYFLPQGQLLQLLAANRCRIWRRWTHLLGLSIADADAPALLAKAAEVPAAKKLLHPVYGARYRLERVLRKVWKTAVEQLRSGGGGGGTRSATVTPRRARLRSRSDVSERSMVFMLTEGNGPLQAQWLVPAETSPGGRARASSLPSTPRSPMRPVPLSPRALPGIQERM